MLKISPIVVIASLVALVGLIMVAVRENGIAIGLAIVATSIFLTCFVMYFAEQHLSLLLR